MKKETLNKPLKLNKRNEVDGFPRGGKSQITECIMQRWGDDKCQWESVKAVCRRGTEDRLVVGGGGTCLYLKNFSV